MRQNLCVRRMNFDAVDAGLIHCEQNIYREYVDQSRDEWQRKMLPTLKRLSLARLMSESGLSRRALLDLRAGRSRPRRKHLDRVPVLVRRSWASSAPVPDSGEGR